MKTRSPGKDITLPDGTIIADGEASCWDRPQAPPVPSDSTKYAKGKCSVCVSQSLPDIGILTLGSIQQYSVRFRDMTNRDMGSANNETLAALDGHTGDKKTVLNMTVGGKPFHLWTMRDPGFPWWAAVYMDWNGPGPTDPFAQPPMSYSHASDNDAYPIQMLNQPGLAVSMSCTESAQSRDKKMVYFTCGFYC